MRTTVDLPEDLIHQARELARAEGITLAALLEAGLREAVAQHHRARHFVLRDKSVAGSGLTAEFADADGAVIRAAGYGAC